MSVEERFIKYVKIDTTSDPASDTIPSSREAELAFADMIVDELRSAGVTDAARDPNGYVMGTVPSTIENYTGAVLGFIAHMDTASDAPGNNIQPCVIKNYDGSDIVLNKEKNIVMKPSEFASLTRCTGQDLIVTDGNTLLGGDDKAGVAEIIAMAEYLIGHPEIKHGPIRIAFTPDEEIGRGVVYFDTAKFGADYAYTMDGGEIGELEYENFNAAQADVDITGIAIHPGSAKGKMLSAARVGMEFNEMLPTFQKPEYTEGYEGFIHLISINGTVEHCRLTYIVRDHDRGLFEQKKAFLQNITDFLNAKYGKGTVALTVRDSYYNMKEKVEPYPFLLDHVKEVYKAMGIEPRIQAIRGGTDGATLSYMGLPCPNLGTGDFNCHGHFEYVSIDQMHQSVEVLVRLAVRFASEKKRS